MDDMREMIAYYMEQGAPQDQQMLIALLREAQEASGGVLPRCVVDEVAKACGMKATAIDALIRRVPSLRREAAPHRLEICGTCRAGAKLRSAVEKNYQVTSGGCNEAAGFSYHVTPCMKNCKNGPSVRWDGQLVPAMDADALLRMIDGACGGR